MGRFQRTSFCLLASLFSCNVLVSSSFQDKEARQKALKEQLQKQKASISTNEPEAMEQRKLFMDLSKLLAAKVPSCS